MGVKGSLRRTMAGRLAPIALFVYKRPEVTRRTISALAGNSVAADSDLIVFCDGPRTSAEEHAVLLVRKLVKDISGFRSVTVHEHDQNKGLARSLIDGTTTVLSSADRVIVLEDDILTSKYFLQFMNDALRTYASDESVASVHGYSYPVHGDLPETYFLRGADCWGWATWKRAWSVFDEDAGFLLRQIETQRLEWAFNWDGSYDNVRMLRGVADGTVDSWAIRWHASAFLRNMMTLYPGRSLVNNIGQGEHATHTKSFASFQAVPADRPVEVKRIPIAVDPIAQKAVSMFLRSAQPGPARLAASIVFRSLKQLLGIR